MIVQIVYNIIFTSINFRIFKFSFSFIKTLIFMAFMMMSFLASSLCQNNTFVSLSNIPQCFSYHASQRSLVSSKLVLFMQDEYFGDCHCNDSRAILHYNLLFRNCFFFFFHSCLFISRHMFSSCLPFYVCKPMQQCVAMRSSSVKVCPTLIRCF